ncbi:MAG: hypothetical protein JWM68_3309 [Verrucomicrobiales bacterium]|nr:hypothetical protein [Verrucomicrobiales bacterium]
MTAQKTNPSASAAHHYASDSTFVRPRTWRKRFALLMTTSLTAPSSRLLLAHQFFVSRSRQSAQKVRGRMSSVTAFVARVAVSSFISALKLTTAQAGSGVRSLTFDAMTETPNHALQRTRRERRGCNPRVPCPGSLSLGH